LELLFMKLLLNVNLIQTLIQIKLQFSFGEFVCLFQFSFFSLFIRQTSHFDFFISEYRDKGLTPEIPSNCPQKLVELMQMCWKKQPQQRPVSIFLLFLFLRFKHSNSIIWFVSSLIEILIGFWNNLCTNRELLPMRTSTVCKTRIRCFETFLIFFKDLFQFSEIYEVLFKG
jgi:hypothetical protein